VLGNGQYQERYRAPHCGGFSMRKGERLTLIAFHRPLGSLSELTRVWEHAVAYGFFVPAEPYGAVEDLAPIPHAMAFFYPEATRKFYSNLSWA